MVVSRTMSLHTSEALAAAGIQVCAEALTVEVHASAGPDRQVAITALRAGLIVEWRDADGCHSCQLANGVVGPVERNEPFVIDALRGEP